MIKLSEDQPVKDKYKAVWLSHSSIADYLHCPRLYYLRAIYKDPATFHKITVFSPHLALGQIIHEVVEGLSTLPVDQRLVVSPVSRLENLWPKISGEKGGFSSSEQEKDFKDRAIAMLKNLQAHPGPLLNKAVKIKTEDGLPYYWFSEEKNTILCGKIDWLEYLESENGVHIIDFKSGRHEEDDSSLQLPIYYLLASNTQNRKVLKSSYWYLDKADGLREKKLPSVEEAVAKVEKVAERIVLARKLNHFQCPTNGCKYCTPYEMVLKGRGKLVGTSEYKQDIYILH